MLLLLSLLLLLLAPPSAAWRWGSSGRARWELQCQFVGSADSLVVAQPHVASSVCGDLCLLSPECSHFSWTPPMAGEDVDGRDGTCWLRKGESAAVSAHGTGICGFMPDRFTLDESSAFDLDMGPLATSSKGELSDKEAETLLRTLNFLRLGRGVGRLQMDVRLLLAARDLSRTCPQWANSDASTLPVELLSGKEAMALAAVTAGSETVNAVLEIWASGMSAAEKAIFAGNASAIGFAKTSNTYCRTTEVAQAVKNHRAPTTTTVWTVLLS